MKLETKHYMDAYLHNAPCRLSKTGIFNLDLEYPDSRNNKIGFISRISFDDDNVYGELKISDNYSVDFDFSLNDNESDIELIKRPLSDLLKDITVGNDVINFQKHFNQYDFEWLITSNNKRKLINSLDYFIVSKMVEYHFDWQGLIPQKLAIDINTL